MSQFVNIDLGALRCVVDGVLDRASNHPRWWIVVWVVIILMVTLTAVVCHAPTIVYLIVLTVIGLLFAGGPRP